MRFLVIGTFQEDSLESFFSQALANAGPTDVLDIGSNWLVKYRMQVQNTFPRLWDLYCHLKIAQNLRYSHYEIVFVIMRDLHPKLLTVIRNKAGSPRVVNINPDQMTTLGRMYALSEEYDFIFMKDRYLLRRLARIGVENCYAWSECYPREWSTSLNVVETTNSVVIFGNIYFYRHLLIEKLVNSLPGVNIKVYGTPDRHVRSLKRSYEINPPIYGVAKQDIINKAYVVINNLHFAEVDSANNKFFEIIGCGGIVLNEKNSEMSRLLKGDLNYLLWDNIEELTDKILFLINNKNIRDAYKVKLNQYREKVGWDYHAAINQILKIIDGK